MANWMQFYGNERIEHSARVFRYTNTLKLLFESYRF